jgi:hypothetical protein
MTIVTIFGKYEINTETPAESVEAAPPRMISTKISPGAKGCQHCGGLVARDEDELVCLNCARRSYPPAKR